MFKSASVFSMVSVLMPPKRISLKNRNLRMRNLRIRYLRILHLRNRFLLRPSKTIFPGVGKTFFPRGGKKVSDLNKKGFSIGFVKNMFFQRSPGELYTVEKLTFQRSAVELYTPEK